VSIISIQSCEWKQYPKNMNNKLHTLCSYMAMFPPSVPHYFIEKYSKEGGVVLDPFSGRGTTILEANFMNRTSIGNDKNPLAYLLTKTKSSVPQIKRILSRVENLEREFNQNLITIKNEEKKIRMIFSDYTLKQLVFLKKKLNWRRSNVDSFIAAMVLGIMHGNSEGYLSLSMPNTFSMSPNYIKNFVKKNKLRRPNRNAFDLLRRKLDRCYQNPKKRGKVFSQDVRRMTKVKDSSVNLIITSPPYTRVIRYGEFNWIRLWFLDKRGKEIDKKLFFSQSLPKYYDFMSSALKEFKRVLRPEGKAVLVIGDVKDRTSEKIFNLAEGVWKNCAQPLGFQLVEPIQADVISDNTKVSKIWGDKKGNATKTDRILVLRK